MAKKRILLIWELGAGMGHTSRLRPLAERVMSLGHEVTCTAIREKDAARHLPCPVEEAPWLKAPKRKQPVTWVGHLADTLAALGWSQTDHLRESVRRWRAVLIDEKPDLIVMDSAPTAMLASLGLPMQRVWLANHWSTPPRVKPIPDLQKELTGQNRPIPDTEPAVVEAINACLNEQDQPTITHLYELFDRADDSPMLSIPEIDPHGPRPQTEYLGVWASPSGAAPPWPTCEHGPDTPGVFAYLKPFPHRGATLQLLAQTGLPVQAYTPGLNDIEAKPAGSSNLKCHTSPIDWLAKQQSTAFILCHGGAGMTGQALQLGLPVLALPTSLEQSAVTLRASQTGACIGTNIQDIRSIGSALEQMFSDDGVFEAAEKLGEKYASYSPGQAAIQLADRLTGLVAD
ncbi:MAG: hypothetical protein AAGB26_16955 [Planctomycetota bacterium]